MKVGDYTIEPIIDGSFAVPPKVFFANVTDEEWLPHKRFLNDDGQIEMPVGGFLIRGRDRVVLVDTGMGYSAKLPQMGGRFLESLAAADCEPNDVTDILFSHLHFDHIGWVANDGTNRFPNANIRCHAQDWDHFVTHETHQGPFVDYLGLPAYTKDWLGPVLDRIETWEGDATVLPGIDVRDAPGHTPGSTIIVVSSGEERALLLGDAVHCPAELLESEWELLGDVDPGLARRTREALAREFEGTDVPMAAPHFPDMRFGRLLPAQGRMSFVFD